MVCVSHGVLGFEDVEDTMDICLDCSGFNFLFVLLVDAYFFKVGVHGVLVYGFGSYYEVELV